eukprot:TRINITY_DN10318_c0_g1_i3.p1 TRINITY_DN10318_c0_g1~~TRINITY_DN10318_c0_g1_i3.p1  ORF type:complete len:1122 (-),score=271.25 TRINITY_DN10318_c0_g1_i3:329-3694(-)
MEDMDDFGDLYADVEVHVNTGIENVDGLYIGGNNNEGNPKGVYDSDLQKKDVELDSDSEEETNGDDKKASGKDSAITGPGPGNESPIVEDGSESEDDLHIVLNEDDCRALPISQGGSVGNGGRVGGGDDEEDDDLVIVTEADHSSKDRKPIDGLEQSVGGPGAERGNASKGAYASQYSQFKYVRAHAATFPSNSKAHGSAGAVSFSSPLSGRGDWDVDGGNQQIMSRSGLDTSAFNLGITTMSQKRFDFHLPRNRTVLDVNIDTFEWKPWRYPGVDITDFFNFGFDEESWKSYCKSLEHFRKQTTMLTKIPVYQSSRPNQACEDEFLQKTEAFEAIAGKIAQTEQRDGVSSMSENVYWSARSFEIPKGRAIQVEGGIGERLPSIDVRRPRYRDSDVVIQIPMHDTTDDSSISNEKEMEHVGESSGDVCKNGVLEIKDNQSMQHSGSADGDLIGHHLEEVMEPVSKETNEELVTVDGRDIENISKVRKATLDSDSTSCDQIQCNLSPSILQSQSEASKAGAITDVDNPSNHVRRPSSSSLSGSGHHRSKNGSTRNTSKKEYKDDKSSSPEQHLIHGERNYYGGVRPRSLAGLEIPMDSAGASIRADRKGRYNGDHLRRETRKGRQHSYNFDDHDSIKDEFRYRERELSNGYHDRRFVEKQERRNSSMELIHRKSEPHFQEEKELYGRRDWDGRDYLDERFMAGDDEMQPREYYFRERGHCDGGMSVVGHKESDLLVSENTCFYSDRERYLELRRKIEHDRRSSKESDEDDYVYERMYREEFIREKHGRHVVYYGTEDFIQEKYGKRVPHFRRETVRSNRRERDAQTPFFGLDDTWRDVDDGKYGRNSDHKLLSPKTFRELHIADERGRHDSSPPRNHAYDSWRSSVRYEDNWRSDGRCSERWKPNEKYVDNWRSNDRYADHWRMPDLHDMQSNKYMEEGYFLVKGEENHCQSHHRRDIDFDEDSYHSGPITSNGYDERKRYRCQWTDEEATFGCQERDGSFDPEASFLLERSLRHERSHLDHDPVHDRKHLDDFSLERSGKKITVGKCVHSKASKCISSTSDIADWGKREMTALRCKEPINLHLSGWERKVKLGKPKLSLAPCIIVMCKHEVEVSLKHGLHE